MPPIRRILGAATWIFATVAIMGVAFVASFFFAMRGEQRASEVAVPDLRGLTLAAAGELAESVSLIVDVVEQRHDPAVASGRVLQQVPRPLASVRRGRRVKLIISLGGKVLEVPDLTRETSRTVAIELRRQGFAPGDEVRVFSRQFEKGRIISQAPPPLSPAVPNTRVHRLVSSGARPKVWVMPDFAGLSEGAVTRWLNDGGFRRGAVRRVTMSGFAPGTIVGQSPLSGHPIRSRDIVELTVVR